MKWIKTKNENLKENYVEIHYQKNDQEIENLICYLEADKILFGKKNEQIQKLRVEDIFYCEIVDRKCFAYMEKEVYMLEMGLQNFLQQYETSGFVRIGKSLVVNVCKIDSLKADLNMRVKVYLENGEIVVVNRSYRHSFYNKLKKMKEEVESNAAYS